MTPTGAAAPLRALCNAAHGLVSMCAEGKVFALKKDRVLRSAAAMKWHPGFPGPTRGG